MKKLISSLAAALLIFGAAVFLPGCSEIPEIPDIDMDIEFENDAEEETGEVSLPDDSYFFVRFFDVGQADAALIGCDGHYMLIDGGNRNDSDMMYTVLERDEIDRLDLVIGTHAHEDHIGGIAGALSYAEADTVLSPVTDYSSMVFSKFKEYAEENGGGLIVPSVGDVYSLGNAQVTVLGVNSSDETNNTSIITKITYGDTSFLFMGDAEIKAENLLLESGADLSADVLKVGHHGSDSSTGYQFLREVMPDYAVVSVGPNKYGHPMDEVLSRLRDADVEVYRTDEKGDITFVSDGENIAVSADKYHE